MEYDKDRIDQYYIQYSINKEFCYKGFKTKNQLYKWLRFLETSKHLKNVYIFKVFIGE